MKEPALRSAERAKAPQPAPSSATSGRRGPPDRRESVLALQRRVGNRAVGNLLARAKVARADDAVEREACTLAERAVAGATAGEPRPRPTSLGSIRTDAAPLPRSAREVLRSPGQPLAPALASEMEARMGSDFRGVRTHADVRAAGSARALGARAYTAGRHVVFAAGAFQPGTRAGRILLAHELAHVIQQGAAAPRAAAVAGAGGRERSPSTASPAGPVLMLDRDPDLAAGGTYTWYIDLGGERRVFAIQIGQYRDSQPGRVALRIASLRPAMENPAPARRTMLLALPASAPLSPTITAENETRTPDGNGYEKTIEIELQGGGRDSLTVGVILLHHSARHHIPFHDPSAFGSAVWRRAHLESGFAAASDGLHDLSANFSAIHPSGSLYGPGTTWFRHPALGLGRRLPSGTFVPMPRRPVFDEALEQVGQELIRTGIHMVPVVGTLVMIGEALVGRDIWGRQLSTTERALLGAGALLSSVGPLLRAGRTVAAAGRLSTVAGVSRTQALRMVVLARSLTDAERATITRLAAKIRRGEALTAAEQVLANRVIGKMNERLRVQALRAELEATTGTARRQGRFSDLSGAASRDEQRIGNALARDLNADVVRPPDLPTSPATRGMRNPDYFLNDVAAEAISPRTANVDRLLNNVVDKHRQAGTVVVDLTHTTVTADGFLGQAHRLWPRPNFQDVTRVLVVRESRVVADLARPVSVSAAPAATRGAASVLSRGSRGEPEAGDRTPGAGRDASEAAPAGGGGLFHTQTVELEGSGPVIHFQIGRQPDFHPGALSIRFAPARPGYRTVPADERTMLLSGPTSGTPAPSTVEERDFGDGRRKILRLRLSGSETETTITVAVEESRLYVYASDGTHSIRVFFPRGTQ